MCLYPKLINNPKYKKTKKNGGVIPPILDERVTKVAIGCQECIECRKQKANGWKIRMMEEIRHDNKGKFVVLTFDTESIRKLTEEIQSKGKSEGYDLDNDIATRATRLFLERWRKRTGKSVKHWLVTELGHGETEHVHIHGLIWTDEVEMIKRQWGYGFAYVGDYVNEKSVNYIVKYVSKVDKEHKYYKPIILTSAGIGGGYKNRYDYTKNEYKGTETDETYRTRAGVKIALPAYYRNARYTEEEREKLWINKLDKMERWVLGVRVDIKDGDEEYVMALKEAQNKNRELGYGSGERNWEEEQYERERRILKQKERIQKK